MADDSAVDPFPLLKLPNEIITKIIEKSGEEERKTISSLNERLQSLEKKAPKYPRFDYVYVNRIGIFVQKKRDFCPQLYFTSATPAHEIEAFFKNAHTNHLEIEGVIEYITERRINFVAKAIQFDKLTINIRGKIASSVFCNLFQKSIKKVEIFLSISVEQVKTAQELLLSLPPMESCRICVNNNITIITDEILLDIASKTDDANLLGCRTDVTADGLWKALLEVFGNSKTPKRANFNASSYEVGAMVSRMDNTFENGSLGVKRCYEHIETLARIFFTVSNDPFYPVLLEIKGYI